MDSAWVSKNNFLGADVPILSFIFEPMKKMKMAEPAGSRSYGSVLGPKEQGAHEW